MKPEDMEHIISLARLGEYSDMIECVKNLIRYQSGEWQKALVSLTPCGSEFADDPARCVQYVRDRFDGFAPKEILRLRNRIEELERQLDYYL